MAELIDRRAFLKRFTQEYKTKITLGEAKTLCLAFNELEKEPTTTEAEIRAKAHQEFYDKVLNFEDYIEPIAELDGVQLYSGRDITRMVCQVAEQLKGE